MLEILNSNKSNSMKKIIFLLVIIFLINIGNEMYAQAKYCRYEFNSSINYGIVKDEIINALDKAPWFGGEETGETVNLEDVMLLHPSEPVIILGLGMGYKNAWENKELLNSVRWFLKPPTAAASPNEDIILPSSLDEAKAETELVIVIGKTVKDAEEAEAEDAIFGYTIGNDMVGYTDSYHRVQNEPMDYPEKLLGSGLKICDKFAPFGPFIYTGIDYNNRPWTLTISNTETGKKLIEENNTNNMFYTPKKIVSDLSKVLTLNPGDIIFAGTSKSLVAADGDIVTVKIDGLGTLANKIVASKK